MAIAVRTGEEGGVAWRGPGIGVVVIAVGKVRAVIEEDAESGIAELIMIAIQIVAAELINHDDDNQLGMSVVGGCKTVWAGEKNSGEACQKERKKSGCGTQTPCHSRR